MSMKLCCSPFCQERFKLELWIFRLYEQETGEPYGSYRLGLYVRRCKVWVWADLLLLPPLTSRLLSQSNIFPFSSLVILALQDCCDLLHDRRHAAAAVGFSCPGVVPMQWLSQVLRIFVQQASWSPLFNMQIWPHLVPISSGVVLADAVCSKPGPIKNNMLPIKTDIYNSLIFYLFEIWWPNNSKSG